MTLAAILEREFELLAKAQSTDNSGGPVPNYRTVTAQAEFLGVTKSWLSRLLRNKAPLTAETAVAFADRLQKRSGDGRSALLKQLLALTTPARGQSDDDRATWDSGDVQTVKRYYDRLAQPHAFMSCEYRDPPRTDRNGKYRSFAQDLGRTISLGCHVALFLPFGNASEKRQKNAGYYHSRIVRDFIWMISNRAREAYLSFLGEALLHNRETKEKPEPEADVARRVILYERGPSYPVNFVTGIQSRIFYSEIPNGSSVDIEIWDWVAAPERDFFIRRDESNLPINVMVEQFCPIIEWWREQSCLLTKDADIGAAVKSLSTRIDARLPDDVWLVSDVTKTELKKLRAI